MASIIRVKRSTGNTAPSNLQFGEVALTIGAGVAGNKGERLFVGDDSLNSDVVGGKYYTDLMAHTPGSIAGVANAANAANGFVAIVDQNRKVDEWNVDDLRLDGNTLSSQTTDADIIFNPDGSGEVMIPDDTKLGFGGGTDGAGTSNATIEYDENGTDELTFAGADVRFTNSKVFVDGDLEVQGGNSKLGNIRIENNIIASLSGAGNKIFIDPFPDGLSNEGDVVIKGNLQVDGTTTTVNSTQTTVNDPIMMVGDTTSTRTVMVTVNSGDTSVVVDQVTGIAVDDTLLHPSFSASGITTVTAIDTGTKTLTFQGTTVAGISTQTEITVVHATDTNTDRGLGFTYNTGIGTANATHGFFGLDDSSLASVSPTFNLNHGSHGDASRRWTYVPDATISNSVVTGTKGFLDIKGIYYQAGDFNTGGVVWFDVDGLQRSTNNPQTPVTTSKQILTAITKNTLTLGSAITASAGDIIKQDTTGAFGVVETGVSGSTSVSLIGVEGTFNTSNNLRLEGDNGSIQNLASVPNTVSVIYTNKPHWTSTLDGGTF